MIVLDTTVLVYAKGAEHPLRDSCRRLVEAVEDGKLVATTTTEVIQEFAHVRARRRDRTDATGLARDFAALFAPLLVIEEGHLHEGLELFEQLPHLGCFDAILAAAARSVRATALVSADRAFDDVPHLTHVVPDGAGVNALLAPAPGE